MQRKLEGLKENLLSLGGCIILLNASLLATPRYFLSFFNMPKWVEVKIDSIRRKFLLKGEREEAKGYKLVNWCKVCKPREEGGLGVINLRNMNHTLL